MEKVVKTPIVALSVRGHFIPLQQAIPDEKEYRELYKPKPDEKRWDMTVVLYYQTPEGLDGHELQVLGNHVLIEDNHIDFGGSDKHMQITRKPWWAQERGDMQLLIKYRNSLSNESTEYVMDPRIRLERVKEVLVRFLREPTPQNLPPPSNNEEPLTEQEEQWQITFDMYMDAQQKMYEELNMQQDLYEFPYDPELQTVQTGLIEFLPRYAKNIVTAKKTRRASRQQRRRKQRNHKSRRANNLNTRNRK